MLIDLHFDPNQIEKLKEIYKENNWKWQEPIDLQEKGFCIDGDEILFKENLLSYNIDEFKYFDDKYNKLAKEEGFNDCFDYLDKHNLEYKSQFGVADDEVQIKEYFKEEIADPKEKFFITIRPIFQHKEREGEEDGWRWYKWGPYIGKLNPQCEYLDDEDFGKDFKGYVLCFHLKHIKNE